jgi:hypothetical protein
MLIKSLTVNFSAYLYDKIGGNDLEGQHSRFLLDSGILAFLVGWYIFAACAFLYSMTANLYEQRIPAK